MKKRLKAVEKIEKRLKSDETKTIISTFQFRSNQVNPVKKSAYKRFYNAYKRFYSHVNGKSGELKSGE